MSGQSLTKLMCTSGKAYQVDVRDAEEVEKAITSQVKEFNDRLDIFVANAGIPWVSSPVCLDEAWLWWLFRYATSTPSVVAC